jgi:hypothetical protein
MKTLQSTQAAAPFSDAVISSPISIQSTGHTSQFKTPISLSERSSTTHAMAALLMLPIALTFSVISSSVVIEDPAQRLRNSGAVSVWGRIRRRGTRVSLAHARLRALQILAETEARIQLERQQEFASLFADEDINT